MTPELKAALVKVASDLVPFLYIAGVLLFVKLIYWLMTHIDD